MPTLYVALHPPYYADAVYGPAHPMENDSRNASPPMCTATSGFSLLSLRAVSSLVTSPAVKYHTSTTSVYTAVKRHKGQKLR